MCACGIFSVKNSCLKWMLLWHETLNVSIKMLFSCIHNDNGKLSFFLLFYSFSYLFLEYFPWSYFECISSNSTCSFEYFFNTFKSKSIDLLKIFLCLKCKVTLSSITLIWEAQLRVTHQLWLGWRDFGVFLRLNLFNFTNLAFFLQI